MTKKEIKDLEDRLSKATSELEKLEIQSEDPEVQILMYSEEEETFKKLDREDLIGSYVSEANYSLNSLNKSLAEKGFRDKKITEEDLDEKSKNFEHSNQSKEEIKTGGLSYYNSLEKKIATMPYNPCDLSNFVEINALHKQACQLKARDTAGRDYKIKPKYPILKDNSESTEDHSNFTKQEDFQIDCRIVQDFIDKCNSEQSFQEMSYLVAYDREMIGWGAFEVIRQADGKVAKLIRIPAERLRVLQGWEGFLEVSTERQLFDDKEIYTYYQPFGDKLKVSVPDPFDMTDDESKRRTILVDYDPSEHGELNTIKNTNLQWNLKSKKTGEEIATNAANFMNEAANEVIFLPKVHPNTVYYGYSDIIAASHAVQTIANIEAYVSQFFQNNCVPRYAVIIKGAKVSPNFIKQITEYFTKNIKEGNGKTLVLSIPSSLGASAEIEFRRIDADQKEADFLETKKSYQQDILTAHEVPPSLLQVHDSASLGSGKGTAQAESYKDRFVVPTQRIWAQKLNKLFKLGLGVVNAEIQFDPLDVKDARTTADVLNILLLNGVLTINEARRELGLDPITNGDLPILKVRGGSLVRVDQLHLIKSKLMDDEFEITTDEKGKESVDLDELTKEENSTPE